MKGLRAALITGLLAVVPVQGADYTRYHTYEQLTSALRDLAKAHPQRAKLVEVAKSREGRSVWAIEIANPGGTPVAERPALLIAANLEGDQLIGSALALYVAEQLLTGYAANPTIKQRLDEHVFYVVPRVNPDGAEAMFGAVKAARKTNSTPFDNDNDGRLDEDSPEDLNKDGFISVMRVKDPNGPYMIHPDDPRLMRRADAAKGEAGGYAIYWEGLDNDGDGFFNEDPAGGVDLNRNFQHQYPYYQPDAAGDDRGAGRSRVLPHDRRSLSPGDRHSCDARDAHPGRRVLRVRLLPVRRAVLFHPWLGHHGRRRRTAGRAWNRARRWARRGRRGR